MNPREFFAKYPDLAQAYQQYNATQKSQATPEQFLQMWSQRNPTDSRAVELSAGIFAPDANTRSEQTGTQQGNFASTGTTNQQQTQTQQQTGTQAQTGTSTQQGQTGVVDTLGFGQLLQGSTGAAQAADQARQGFLTDLVATGGQGFNQQVEQAANQALSGPGMLGVGNAAKGRIAGSAIGDVARNNAGLRLQATQQLAGPTAISSLVQAGNPYLGQTQTQTGQNTSTGTTTQNSAGFQDLVSNEAQSGTSNASTQQSGFGNQPTQEGGCYVSSVCAMHGRVGMRVIRAAVKYKASQRRFRYMLWGYSLFGPFLARWIDRRKWATEGVTPICRAILYQELRWSGRSLPWKPWPALLHAVFHYGSALTGLLSGRRSVTACVPDLKEKMAANNLLFKETY